MWSMNASLILLQIVNLFSVIVGSSIGLRFVLRLFGANPSAIFVQLVDRVSNVFLFPFLGMFPDIPLYTTGVIDMTAVVGLIIYTLLFSFIYSLVDQLAYQNEQPHIHHVHG